MPTNDQPNNPLAPEELMDETLEASANILEEEAEALPEQESSSAASNAFEAYQEGDGLAPFANTEHDPGMEDLETGEEEEASTPEPIVYRDLSGDQLQAAVEACLFMQQKPITVNRIRELINPEINEDDYRSAISNLMASYFEENRGIELVEVANGFQLRTKPENKDIIRRMYQIAPMKLTNAMLEVLAIAAYNQPLTREGIDKIRGVDSSHLLRVLLDKKMLRIAGKSDTVGNPMIYATTKEFLELFGLRDLGALPSLRDLEEMLPKNEVGSISEEEALASEMEVIVAASKPIEFNDLELAEVEEERLESPQQDEARFELPRRKDESQKIENQETTAAVANSDGGETLHNSAETEREAGGDADLPPEIARRITPGQEGNA